MSYLIYLIPLSIALGLLGVVAFIWALRNDQFDDPEGNAARVLLIDSPPQPKGLTDDKLASHADNENA